MLVSALAFGQADQPTTARQPASQQPTTQHPPAQQSATPRPIKPQSVADTARASNLPHESPPPGKVYRNKDVRDPADAVSSPTGAAAASAAQTAAAKTTSQPAAQASDDLMKKDAAFESQGKIFKSQILVEKGKIIQIQNHITDLKNQFAAWSAEFSQDYEAPMCWTAASSSPYYKDWCDTGRNLKAQYEAAQHQLGQEKARLEQMQEDIRRKGYGNSVYDPD